MLEALTCIFAAMDNGRTLFASCRTSAIRRVPFLDKFEPVVVS